MGLYFSNVTNDTLWIAFVYYDLSCGFDNLNYHKQGWWQVDGGQIFNAWNTDLSQVNQYAYFYAESNGTTWAGTGDFLIDISQAPFNQCAFDNANVTQNVNFIQLDFASFYGLQVVLQPDGQWFSVPL